MLEFREIEIEDKPIIEETLSKVRTMSCEYVFGNYYIWKKMNDSKIAFLDGDYIIFFENYYSLGKKGFLFPTDAADTERIISAVLEYCSANEIEPVFFDVSKDDVEKIKELFLDKCEITEQREHFDYIYSVEDLAALPGRKFHGKRNHLARFKENNWSFELITRENIEDCIAMNGEWCRKNDCRRDEILKQECCAVKLALKNFFELDFFGGLIRVDGKVAAYTVAERLNGDTAAVHIEKAFSEIQGAYTAINQQFAEQIAQKNGYKYLNREEDVGVEGLRRAKLSYNPVELHEKYKVRFVNI